MAKLAIGVDFGGTKVLAAVVDVESGKVWGPARSGPVRPTARTN